MQEDSLAELIPKLKHGQDETGDFLPHTRRIASLAAEHKAADIRAYDVRGITLIADSFVLCTANSEPQMKAIFNAVRTGMREAGLKPLHVEGAASDGWIVLDYGSVICHVFRQTAREYYDLDGLWGDAEEIALDLESG
jgi:ribosome-associated protein